MVARSLATLVAMFALSACGIPAGGGSVAACALTTRCLADSDCPMGTRCDDQLNGGVCARVLCASAGTPCGPHGICASGWCDEFTKQCTNAAEDRPLYTPCGDLAEGTLCTTMGNPLTTNLPACLPAQHASAPGGRVCTQRCAYPEQCPPVDGVIPVCAQVGPVDPAFPGASDVVLFCLPGCPTGQCPAGFRCQVETTWIHNPMGLGEISQTAPTCIPSA